MNTIQYTEDALEQELYGSPKLPFEQGDSPSQRVTIDSCTSSDSEDIEKVEFEKGLSFNRIQGNFHNGFVNDARKS